MSKLNPFRLGQLSQKKVVSKSRFNPLASNLVGWVLALPVAVVLFLQLKKQIDKNRLADLKAIQRMRQAQSGEDSM